MATFVNGITVARKQAHLTQQQLADIMHVSLRTVSRWEKIPPEEIAEAKIPFGALARALGVTTDELMSAPSEDNKKAPAGSPGEGDILNVFTSVPTEEEATDEKIKELTDTLKRNGNISSDMIERFCRKRHFTKIQLVAR